jgi:hypothetical protein
MKIEKVDASVWYNAEETQATCYAKINGAPDNVMFTFYGKKFEEGVCASSRVRLQKTKEPIDGITATLALPYEEDNSDGWVLTITVEGEDPVTVKMLRDQASHFEDGTRRFNRPVGSGSYEARRLHFFDWLEEAPKKDQVDIMDSSRPTIHRDVTGAIIRNMVAADFENAKLKRRNK